MYKLIALDIDGTLVNDEKKVTDRTKAAIKAAREKGVTVVLATGRPIDGIMRYLEELDMFTESDYALSYNGSLVLKTKDREIVSKVGLLGSDLKYLFNLSKELGVNIHAFSEERGLITPKDNKYTQVEATLNNIKYSLDDYSDISDDHSFIKIMMIDEPEKLDAAIEKLPKEVYEKYTVVKSAPFFLEFMNKKVNKGVGVELLAKYLNVKQEEIITMGDAGNDSHMIEYAGMGIAMGNATDDIKEIANYITESNNEDGVAKAIEKFVLNK